MKIQQLVFVVDHDSQLACTRCYLGRPGFGLGCLVSQLELITTQCAPETGRPTCGIALRKSHVLCAQVCNRTRSRLAFANLA